VFRADQQCRGRVQRARVALGGGGRESTLRAATRFWCQGGGAFQERRGSSSSAPCLRAIRRLFQLDGNRLVRPGGGVRSMPRAAVMI
jgi:hypothetical protein